MNGKQDAKDYNYNQTVNQRFLVSANTRLHVCDVTTSWCHIDITTIIVIHCDSLCTNCRFLKTGIKTDIGVLQTPTSNDGFSNCEEGRKIPILETLQYSTVMEFWK